MKRIMPIFAMVLFAGCTTMLPRDDAAVLRMKSVIVCEVDFRNAAMSDVVNFMANSWHCVCHPWINPTQEIDGDTVTYHFHVDQYDSNDPNGSIDPVKGTNETSLVRLGPMVTLHAEKISVYIC
jgi:hypothetical protein